MESGTRTNMWERMPTETAKSYAAFQVYRDLPASGSGVTRSISKTAQLLGYSSDRHLKEWSIRFKWVERAEAYDRWREQWAIAVARNDADALQQAVMQKTAGQISQLDAVIDKALYQMVQADVVEVDTLAKLTSIIEKKDAIARRLAKLPNNYRADQEKKKEVEEEYIIGES